MMAAMSNPTEAKDTMKGRGTFTPPPAPCGHDGCRYVGFEVAHVPDCEDH